MYGHIKKMVEAYKKGLETVEGVEVKVFQVAETLPAEVLGKMGAPPKGDDPIIDVHTLPEADAFVFAFPTRFGTLPAQFKTFIDSMGGLWQKGALYGKPYALIASTATQGGGQESTFFSAVNNFTHHGMIFVPGGYCDPAMFDTDNVQGGSPWGPGCIAGATGARQPSEIELNHATAAATKFGAVAKKLAAP